MLEAPSEIDIETLDTEATGLALTLNSKAVIEKTAV